MVALLLVQTPVLSTLVFIMAMAATGGQNEDDDDTDDGHVGFCMLRLLLLFSLQLL